MNKKKLILIILLSIFLIPNVYADDEPSKVIYAEKKPNCDNETKNKHQCILCYYQKENEKGPMLKIVDNGKIYYYDTSGGVNTDNFRSYTYNFLQVLGVEGEDAKNLKNLKCPSFYVCNLGEKYRLTEPKDEDKDICKTEKDENGNKIQGKFEADHFKSNDVPINSKSSLKENQCKLEVCFKSSGGDFTETEIDKNKLYTCSGIDGTLKKKGEKYIVEIPDQKKKFSFDSDINILSENGGCIKKYNKDKGYVFNCDSEMEVCKVEKRSNLSTFHRVIFSKVDGSNECNAILGNSSTLVRKALKLMQYLGPVLAIIFSTLDFIKVALSGKQEDMTKAGKKLGIRIFLSILLFFVLLIVQILLSFFGIILPIDCLESK